MRIRILPSAKADLKRGIAFYEEREPGLGAYFLDALSSDIDSLQVTAGVHSRKGGQYRYLSKRFPFWIYYRMEDATAFVTAILDARQAPAKLRHREQIEKRRGEFPAD